MTMRGKTRSDPPLFYGLDIGGTKIGLCLGDDTGKIHAHAQFANDPHVSPERLIDKAIHQLHRWGKRDSLAPRALGAACPGPMSSREGRFIDPPNMPRWHGFRLIDYLKCHLDIPVAMMNDANACALAEWLWGAARGFNTAVFLTMSTGMGSGLIIDGRLYEGRDDLAGEIGHIRLDPEGPVGFGKMGSVEGYLSGPGMAQLAQAEARLCRQRGEPTQLLSRRKQIHEITSRDLCEAARKQDPAARRALERSATALGRLLAILTDILNPEVFVLGTIGTAYPDLFIPRARKVLMAEAIRRGARRARIVPSQLEDRRGDLSAIAVACHHTVLASASPHHR